MRRIVLLVLLATLLSACAALPDQRQLKQLLGLEQPFPHKDVPAPASPNAFAMQFGLGQTHRIVVSVQQQQLKYEITDPQAIHTLVSVLRAGAQASAPPDAPLPQAPLQLTFLIGAPERTITAHYNPTTNVLHIYNVPIAAWPDHAVAVYTLTPAFGAALQAALDTSKP